MPCRSVLYRAVPCGPCRAVPSPVWAVPSLSVAAMAVVAAVTAARESVMDSEHRARTTRLAMHSTWPGPPTAVIAGEAVVIGLVPAAVI